MLTISPKYITDEGGNRISVVLSMEEFTRLLEELEDVEDLRLYDKVMARNEPSISLAEYRAKHKTRLQ